jgi:hypothetical protein
VQIFQRMKAGLTGKAQAPSRPQSIWRLASFMGAI